MSCCGSDSSVFATLYIYDTHNEVANRLSHFGPNATAVLRPDIVEWLIEFLDHNNALVQLFRTARDKLNDADVPEFKVRLFGVVGSVQHELHTTDSIGAIVFYGGPNCETEFDVVIQQHSGEPERINKLHPTYMSLQFPLLFVYGEQGYHTGLMLTDAADSTSEEGKRMSIMWCRLSSFILPQGECNV